jgi:hypothetical protein
VATTAALLLVLTPDGDLHDLMLLGEFSLLLHLFLQKCFFSSFGVL